MGRPPCGRDVAGVGGSDVFAAGRVASVLGEAGPDGADIALADALPDGLLLTSFDGLVIASGDHHFCKVAIAASKAGLHVSLVTTKGTLVAAELYRLTEEHIVLPLRSTPHEPAPCVPAPRREH